MPFFPCPSVLFIPVQKLFRINGFHAGFVHSHSSSFKGSMDVRPSTLRTYVLTPSGRTCIDPLNVRPQHPWSYDHKKQIKRPHYINYAIFQLYHFGVMQSYILQ